MLGVFFFAEILVVFQSTVCESGISSDAYLMIARNRTDSGVWRCRRDQLSLGGSHRYRDDDGRGDSG